MKEDLEEHLLLMVKLRERYAFHRPCLLICKNMIPLSALVHELFPDDHHPYSSALSSTGECLFEGAERPASGDFHVQRVKKTRLWGRFQMAITIH